MPEPRKILTVEKVTVLGEAAMTGDGELPLAGAPPRNQDVTALYQPRNTESGIARTGWLQVIAQGKDANGQPAKETGYIQVQGPRQQLSGAHKSNKGLLRAEVLNLAKRDGRFTWVPVEKEGRFGGVFPSLSLYGAEGKSGVLVFNELSIDGVSLNSVAIGHLVKNTLNAHPELSLAAEKPMPAGVAGSLAAAGVATKYANTNAVPPGVRAVGVKPATAPAMPK